MADVKLLDAYGNPIERETLKDEIAGASLTGVRQVWAESIASGMTPARLAAVLQAAADGNPRDYLSLAEDIEERDLHYSSVLRTRKLAVSGLEAQVEAASDDARHQKHADALRELIRRPEFAELVDDQTDGLGKGYAVSEILWQPGAMWWPVGYEWRDPRWFVFDRVTQRALRLLTDTAPTEGAPLPGYKFIVHIPRLKSGLPIRGGLARVAAFAWLCKSYAMKDWLAFAEVFGMPLRLGRYGPMASKADIAVLKRAVATMGTDAAAVLPESMKIEFQEASTANGGGDLFLRLCEFLDKQISKAVLGQTSTSDAQAGGLGSSQSGVHNQVRGDLLRADARQLAATLNRDLVRPFIDLNFGPQDAYPRLTLPILEPEDTKALVDAVARLVPMGLRVGASTIRDKLGLPDPAADEEVLSPPGASPAVAAPLPATQARRRALNAAGSGSDPVDRLSEALENRSQAALDQLMEPIRRLVESADSLEAIRDGLEGMFSELPGEQLAALMREALAVAHLIGRIEVQADA